MRELFQNALAVLREHRAAARAEAQSKIAAADAESAQAQAIIERLQQLHELADESRIDGTGRRANIEKLAFSDEALAEAIESVGRTLAQGGRWEEALDNVARIHFARQHKDTILERFDFYAYGHYKAEIDRLKKENRALLEKHGLL